MMDKWDETNWEWDAIFEAMASEVASEIYEHQIFQDIEKNDPEGKTDWVAIEKRINEIVRHDGYAYCHDPAAQAYCLEIDEEEVISQIIEEFGL